MIHVRPAVINRESKIKGCFPNALIQIFWRLSGDKHCRRCPDTLVFLSH